MAVAAVSEPPRRRASQQDTIAVPIVCEDDDIALGRTMLPQAHTMIATTPQRRTHNKTAIATPVPSSDLHSGDSSLEIPIDAVLLEEAARTRRPITVGDGVLERVPPRRMWLVHAAVIVATLSIAVVALAVS